MSVYRIHRQRDHVRQYFRWAPHVSGLSSVKHRDYVESSSTVEAGSPYGAFFILKDQGSPLDVGDLLENEAGELLIFKYVGFEPALWMAPQQEPDPASLAAPQAE
jgi:hypothetical protein